MKDELIKILRNIAIILNMKGENPFKISAYRNGAEILETEEIDLKKAVEEDTLKDIPGIGDALRTKITDFVNTGKMEYYEKLLNDIPESLIELTKIKGVGPKKAKMLYDDFQIEKIEDLEELIKENKLTDIKGFTERTQKQIIESIEVYRKYEKENENRKEFKDIR